MAQNKHFLQRRSQPYPNNDGVLQPNACAFNRGFMSSYSGSKGFKVRRDPQGEGEDKVKGTDKLPPLPARPSIYHVVDHGMVKEGEKEKEEEKIHVRIMELASLCTTTKMVPVKVVEQDSVGTRDYGKKHLEDIACDLAWV